MNMLCCRITHRTINHRYPWAKGRNQRFCWSKETISLFCCGVDKLPLWNQKLNLSKFNPGDVSWRFWPSDMTRVENLCRFKVSPIFWCSMLAKVAPCFAVLWDEEKRFQSGTLVSRECRADASRSRNHVSLWHWKLQEMVNWRRCWSLLNEWGFIL
jgi:hypothetical protein